MITISFDPVSVPEKKLVEDALRHPGMAIVKRIVTGMLAEQETKIAEGQMNVAARPNFAVQIASATERAHQLTDFMMVLDELQRTTDFKLAKAIIE